MRSSLTFWISLAIIGVLAYLLCIPKIGGHEHSRVTAAMADINDGYKSALDQYKADTRTYPKTLGELLQNAEGRTNWHGPYLDKLSGDPWGNEYRYLYPGTHNTGAYDLFSAGPDGCIGTEDDIGNWTK